MLREDKSAALMKVRRLLGGPPYEFWLQGEPVKKYWKPEVERIQAEERERPVLVYESGGKRWWRFKGAIFVDDEGLGSEDVQALLAQRDRKRERELERARAELRGDQAASRHREPIPEPVRHEVWRRDGGVCVDCGSRDRLELDHIIPISKGGSNTARNIELRCETCNRRKSDRI